MQESNWDEDVVFDRDHLKAFTSGDPFFEKQVLDIFVQNAPGYLVELSQASVDDWSALAHKLKGAARGIGAWRLARASERAELMENSMLTEEISSGVCACLNVRMEELLAYIAELPKDEDGLLI